MKRSIFLWLAVPLLAACSCSTETALQHIMGLNAASPVFYGCKTGAGGEVEFSFSVPVKVMSMYFDPPLDTEVLSTGETVTLRINTELAGGEKVTADILVEDKRGNTLNVLVPFRVRNNRLPGFVINEIRTDYSNSGGTLRVEFIELRITSPGNLGALRLFAAYAKGEDPLWEFPPVEVKTGDYIVVHTRSRETGIVDETGSVSASAGADALPTARDFWVPGDKKILHSTNAVYAMDQDNTILDGVYILDAGCAINENVIKAVEKMEAQGAWTGSPVNVDKTSATATICRDQSKADSNTAADWYVTEKSSATPGAKNSVTRAK
jgi:hypothetical protein